MTFSSKQLSALKGDVDPAFTRLRKLNDGRELPYIEGWYAISEANRIFGFDAWSRETVDVKCLQAREVRGSFQVLYLAKVRLTVRAGDRETVREGYGTGAASSDSLGDAHEKALKSAETDATKRALATFGRPFGLALHVPADQVQAKSASGRPIPDIHRRRTRQRKGPDGRFRVVPDQRLNLMAQAFSVGTAVPTAISSGLSTKKELSEAVGETNPAPTQPGDYAVVPITRPVRRRSVHHLKYVMGQPCR
jgi:DNA recombination protein Rad52